MHYSENMTREEKRASLGLAGIFGLRMLGMFLILPVFALYAEHLPGGDNHTLVGLALGAYGLTQAILQLPFGMASDHFGRKRVIAAGLVIFAIGSFIAMAATDIWWTIVGRSVQGAGAVAAAVMALAADLTREEHRTKAMALIGSTIGVTFAFSLVAGPALYKWIGVPGMFALTGVLALVSIWVVYGFIPDAPPHFHSDAEASPARLRDVLRESQLLRLDFGIFALHAMQMAMFVVIPFALVKSGIAADSHWLVYLPVIVGSFVLAVPAIVVSEKKAKTKFFFVLAVGILLLVQAGFVWGREHFWGIAVLLFLFFAAFNLLEATLPSLISRLAPASAKGTAIGVYNTSQAFGAFLGGLAGGWLSEHHGAAAVFLFCAVLALAWLVFSATMKAPPAVRTRMFHLRELDEEASRILAGRLLALKGVREASVPAGECAAYLKVDMAGFDQQGVLDLIGENE